MSYEENIELLYEQNKFGLWNTLLAIIRYSEKKPSLTINFEYYRRPQIFKKRPHDIRQWFKQVIFVKETGFPLLAGNNILQRLIIGIFMEKNFDDTSIFISV